jgi:hypothetical protein
MKLILTIYITTSFTSGGSGSICMFTDSKDIELTAEDIVSIVNHGSIQIQDQFYKIKDLVRVSKEVLSATSSQVLPQEQHTLRHYRKLKAQGLIVNDNPTDTERIRRRGHTDFWPEKF